MQDFLQSLGLSELLLIVLASVGLIICIVIEQSQLIAKYLGAVRKKVAGGYNSAMKIMVLNRFGAVLYFLLISLSIDLGMEAERISAFFAVSILSVAIFNLVVVLKLVIENTVMLRDIFSAKLALVPIFMSMIAALFGILGLTFPMLLSAENPSLRLTMANTGFLLNAVFTIVTVFFVESYLAKIIDDIEQQHRIVYFVIAVFVMRFVAALAALALMLVLMNNVSLLDINYWL